MENALMALSNELVTAVDQAAHSVVTVNARPRAGSSGVHWRQGVIVTADHTIRHEDDITIGLPGGGTAPATLAGRDPGTDIAVLRADNLTSPAASFSDSEVKPGVVALVVGRGSES